MSISFDEITAELSSLYQIQQEVRDFSNTVTRDIDSENISIFTDKYDMLQSKCNELISRARALQSEISGGAV